MRTNNNGNNVALPHFIGLFALWHHDRNLIDGATDLSQFGKLLEEMLEMRLSLTPGMTPVEAVHDMVMSLGVTLGKGKHKPAIDGSNLPDDIGDCMVVLTNIAERNKHTMEQCAARAWFDIKDRKGKMIDGVFVKQADLDTL